MCGRYLLSYDLESLIKILENRWNIKVSNIDSYEPNYNISPGREVLALFRDNNKDLKLSHFNWGFKQKWNKDVNNILINARGESIFSKPTFKESFNSKRCLILSNGFYEWKKNSSKTPFLFTLKDSELFSFAGLWNDDNLSDSNNKSCVIITTESNNLISSIHNRMPC